MSAHYPDATLRYAYEMTSSADLLLPPVNDMRVDRATPTAAAAECRAVDAAARRRHARRPRDSRRRRRRVSRC
jgi:hypothetical protein